MVGILPGKKFNIVLLCCLCLPVLIVNLSILKLLTRKILVNSGLIEIYFFCISNCFTYIVEGDISDSIETG